MGRSRSSTELQSSTRRLTAGRSLSVTGSIVSVVSSRALATWQGYIRRPAIPSGAYARPNWRHAGPDMPVGVEWTGRPVYAACALVARRRDAGELTGWGNGSM